MSNHKSKVESGFTLLEMCIVTVIAGALLVGAIQAYRVYQEKKNIDQEDFYVAKIDQSIRDYPRSQDPVTGNTREHLPCPAPLDSTAVVPAGFSYSDEARYGTPGCDTTRLQVVAVGAENVLLGKLPVSSLGLRRDDMRDLYGNYILYAVSEKATEASSYASAPNVITINHQQVNETTGVVMPSVLNAVYAFVSFGKNGLGGLDQTGNYTGMGGCPVGAGNDERENCNGDAVFNAFVYKSKDNNRYFDDRVEFIETPLVIADLDPPTCDQYSTMNSYSGSCPSGWEPSPAIKPPTWTIPGGHTPTGVSVINTTADIPGQFFNIDPNTGDYYFSQGETPDTVEGPTMLQHANNKITCKKSAGNKAKTACFEDRVTATIKWGQGNTNIPVSALSNACPNGYKLVDVTNVVTGTWQTGGQHASSQSGNYYSPQVTCGK